MIAIYGKKEMFLSLETSHFFMASQPTPPNVTHPRDKALSKAY